MAYPFGWNPPSIGSFIEVCIQHGCVLYKPENKIFVNSREIQPRILRRETEGKTLHVAIPNGEDDVLISLLLVAQMCRRLELDSALFGFRFDEDTGNIQEVKSS